MLKMIVYFSLIILELLFSLSFAIFVISLLFSSIMGSPYVPTKTKEINEILAIVDPKKNQLFLELGCGDGRVLREATKKYYVCGLGIDVNPLLISLAKIKSGWQKLSNINFKRQNILKSDLSQADVIYIFLMPELIEKLRSKLESETKKNAVIISHGFKIKNWDDRLFKILPNKPFPTYFYHT